MERYRYNAPRGVTRNVEKRVSIGGEEEEEEEEEDTAREETATIHPTRSLGRKQNSSSVPNRRTHGYRGRK